MWTQCLYCLFDATTTKYNFMKNLKEKKPKIVSSLWYKIPFCATFDNSFLSGTKLSGLLFLSTSTLGLIFWVAQTKIWIRESLIKFIYH